MARIERKSWKVDESGFVFFEGRLMLYLSSDGQMRFSDERWTVPEVETALFIRKEWLAAVEREKLDAPPTVELEPGYTWTKSSSGEWFVISERGAWLGCQVPDEKALQAVLDGRREVRARSKPKADEKPRSVCGFDGPDGPMHNHDCPAYRPMRDATIRRNCIPEQAEPPQTWTYEQALEGMRRGEIWLGNEPNDECMYVHRIAETEVEYLDKFGEWESDPWPETVVNWRPLQPVAKVEQTKASKVVSVRDCAKCGMPCYHECGDASGPECERHGKVEAPHDCEMNLFGTFEDFARTMCEIFDVPTDDTNPLLRVAARASLMKDGKWPEPVPGAS
jgi:hypothetical protein